MGYAMRHIIGGIVCMWLTACAGTYQVEGASAVSQVDGKMLFVKVLRDTDWVVIDSMEVIHGLFHAKGECETSMLASLYMDDEPLLPFIVEEGKIAITLNTTGSSVKGTPLNDTLYAFISRKTSLEDSAYDINHHESQLIMDGTPMEQVEHIIGKERQQLAAEMNLMAKQFIQDNYDNILGAGVFIMLCNSFPYPVMNPLIEEIIEQATPTFRAHPLVQDYIRRAGEYERKSH